MADHYNASIQAIPMPDRIKRLAVSPRGFPVPWFVATIDGVPDFRVIAPGRIRDAVNRRRCWVCGDPLGETGATTAPASVVLLPRAGSPSPRAEDTPKVRIADFVQIEQWAAQRGIMFNGDNLDEVNRVARRVGAPQFELRINRRALAR